MHRFKICFKCEKRKLVEQFYRHPQMGDGRLNKCKECAKTDVRENREKNKDYYVAYEKSRANKPDRVKARREYQSTPQGKAAIQRGKEAYRQKYPDKYLAKNMVNNAVRDGRLIKLPCEVCGSTKRIHGHHEDYSRPLEVKWLCQKHHTEVHRQCSAK